MTRKQIIGLNALPIIVWYGFLFVTGIGSFEIIIGSFVFFSIPQLLVNAILAIITAVCWVYTASIEERAAKGYKTMSFIYGAVVVSALTPLAIALAATTARGPGIMLAF